MLKLDMYGQNDGTTVPNVVLTGTPGVDQTTLTNAGYLGGKVMAMVGTYSADGFPLIAPCDAYTMNPYGLLANGPGEFAGAIGPAGSKKAPVFRAMLKGRVDNQAYAGSGFTAGAPIYCGAGANAGFMVATAPIIPVVQGAPTIVPPDNTSVVSTATFTFAHAGDTIFGSFVVSYASGTATTTVIPEGTTLPAAVILLNAGLPAGVVATNPGAGATIVLTGAGFATADTIVVTGTSLFDVKASGGVAVPPIGICLAPPSATNSFFLQFASLL
jgi:hypothetical protein